MTIVAVGAALWRPERSVTSLAVPPLCGKWHGQGLQLLLFPDGFYEFLWHDEFGRGLGWRITRVGDAFILHCGGRQFTFRSQPDSGVIHVLNDDGTAWLQVTRIFGWEGAVKDGQPDGTWRRVDDYQRSHPRLPPSSSSLEYHNGVLADYRGDDGRRDLLRLNEMRKDRGLPPLAKRDFILSSTSERESP
jgi:hypothetical protein